jgi:hypothetical protein
MNRRLAVAACAVLLLTAFVIVWQIRSIMAQPPAEPAKNTVKPSPSLPISQVVLFSSGVGYFQREGEVEGAARVDLSFPVTDINDLLKSLVLQDLGGGKVSTIGYDSPDPLEKILKSFALDLSGSPTFGEILNQARGEKIELTMQQGAANQPATLAGTIVGMETQSAPMEKEVHLLNLLCTEGLRTVPLAQVQRVRFLNPILEADFRRALEILATAHDMEKRALSLSFKGDGTRKVRVGYVVENPIWKTSYRLVLDKNDKNLLQGWATVENPTDEDWQEVRMALVSGRPISFQMDLYQPLYVPRPTVEPELYASLRPPVYSGALQKNVPAGFGGLGGGIGGFGGGLAGFGGGMGGVPSGNRFQRGGLPREPGEEDTDNPAKSRLTYEEWQRRRQAQMQAKDDAKKVGGTLTALDPTQGVMAAASRETLGDRCQYLLDERVTLLRQKSALVPILQQAVETARVSIFNETVLPQFPLLGLRFKNTTGQPLTQGPMTVYDGGTYAGDTRILDLQPNEERLISFAIDLGTEVHTEGKLFPHQWIEIKIVKGQLLATKKLKKSKIYTSKNRSPQGRTLLLEHPVHSEWKLIAPQAAEQSRDVYRFQVAVPSGKTVQIEVVEEFVRVEPPTALGDLDKSKNEEILNSAVSSAAVKEALQKEKVLIERRTDANAALSLAEQELQMLVNDQTRLRANLKEMPTTAAAYKRYLDKFDSQETEIEKLQEKVRKLQEVLLQRRKEYEDYVNNLTVD